MCTERKRGEYLKCSGRGVSRRLGSERGRRWRPTAVPCWSVAVAAARGVATEHLATCARAARERGGARLGGAEGREAARTGERRRGRCEETARTRERRTYASW